MPHAAHTWATVPTVAVLTVSPALSIDDDDVNNSW
jgi:hypothetical protein